MPTIKDVARLVGVSTATVSHVINNTRYVSEGLKKKILEAIDELHYHPNAVARSLVQKKTRTIGIIISDILNPFYTAIVRGIEDVTYQSGYNVMLCNSDEDPEKEVLYIQILLERRIDGLVISSAFKDRVHPLLSKLESVPLVTIVRKVRGLVCDSVFGDNVEGVYQAVRHLIQLGHQGIAIISGPKGLSSGEERLLGYQKALGDHGITVNSNFIKFGDFKRESGYTLTKEVFEQKEVPTALFVANNQMTIGALTAINALRLRVPQGLSLVSFDDMEWYSFLNPPLTTVEQSPYLMGKTAGEMLLQRINQKRKGIKKIIIPSRLIVRGSTAEIGKERR
jgi:LacI family transcriptional regulator